MLLAIDAGNTNIVFAVCDDDKVKHSWRCQSSASRSADEYAAWLLPLLAHNALSLKDISDVIISSVVPGANMNLQQFCGTYVGHRPFWVRTGEAAMQLETLVDKPEEVGADRLVNAIAVNKHYKPPAVVLDFGTATTFDVIDANGCYLGGVIAPGPNLSLNALHSAAAKLPKVSIRKPPGIIGRNTVHAMEAGMYWGYVGLIEGTISRIAHQLDTAPRVIATGGLARIFESDLPSLTHIDDDLTLKGLIELYKTLSEDGSQ